MRMWCVPARLMCRQHLLGEHLEAHMFYGAIRENKNLSGYVQNGLLDIQTLKLRHDVLANEMEYRGYKHNTPLYMTQKMIDDNPELVGFISTYKNLQELAKRCSACNKLQLEKHAK